MMGAYVYGYGVTVQQVNAPMSGVVGYQSMRPGFDVRTLIAAANILARDGQQQACEGVLAAIRVTYKIYVADMHNRNAPMADLPGWERHQIAAAQPVSDTDSQARLNQLVGTEVRNPQNQELGSIDDVVMNPQTNKIGYLIIARGGIFGFGEKYVAVPWQNFKITPSANLMVLDSTKTIMAAGPLVNHNQFSTPGQFDQESQKVDAYWKARLPVNDTTKVSP
ncbi:MAG: PRC-barrel domain-containing protein [Aestuariivirga sp.]